MMGTEQKNIDLKKLKQYGKHEAWNPQSLRKYSIPLNVHRQRVWKTSVRGIGAGKRLKKTDVSFP